MKTKNHQSSPMAIIGMGSIFPHSPDIKAFLRLLLKGLDAISEPPSTHHHLNDYFDSDARRPDHIYCKRGGFLPPVDFDPVEFALPPHALEATDTSQLLGLLTARSALVNAGYGEDGKEFDRERVSIIIGVTGTQELVIPLGARLGHPIWRRALIEAGVDADQRQEVIRRISDAYVGWQENSFPGLLGNVVAGRIANRLDLGGTNCVVDAACASSMGAIHMAALELDSGRSDMVITGGVDTINDIFMHMCFAKSQILSPTGDIRPFSRNADGTVLGEGIGLLVLKRLADAERDGDRIYAVIRGIGSASDGRSSSIYAPRAEGQIRALQRAYQEAGVDPASVDLVEAHGTGTRVGDQVEFKALREVFSGSEPHRRSCALGSVKSNIGHTKATAGTAGLLKAALSLYHKVLPPTLKADPADPKLDLDHSPFYLNTRLRPWMSPAGRPRRAGVSAFGFGGSNFHAVLEEYESAKAMPSWDGSVDLVAFSAPDRRQLLTKLDQLGVLMNGSPDRDRIARLAAGSRREFDHSEELRVVLVLDRFDDSAALVGRLGSARALIASNQTLPYEDIDAVALGEGPASGSMAFIFPGQGSQYVDMGRDLVCTFPESLAVVQDAYAHCGIADLHEAIYPAVIGDRNACAERLRRTELAQPAIGAVSMAMFKALDYFDVRPNATCGHSYGELPALCAAGWLSQENLWSLSAARGRAMAQAGAAAQEPGVMSAVEAPLAQLTEMLQQIEIHPLVLANRNSPRQGVLSGSQEAVVQAEELCRRKGWKVVRLPVAAAFHSPLVARAQQTFNRALRKSVLSIGAIAVMSNTTGTAYPRDIHKATRMLGAQLAHPVDFVANIETLYAAGTRTFIEVGPKNILTRLVGDIMGDRPHAAMAMDRSCGRRNGLVDLACVLARLAADGYPTALERWETDPPPQKQARMTVTLSGANYRNAKAAQPEVARSTQSRHTVPVPSQNAIKGRTDRTDLPKQFSSPPRTPLVPSEVNIKEQPTVMSDQRRIQDKEHLQSALAALQQGMAALQSLQSQTAQAHQKFLEAQAEASRTLRQMMISTQVWTGSATHPDLSQAPSPQAPTDFPSQSMTLQSGPGKPGKNDERNAPPPMHKNEATASDHAVYATHDVPELHNTLLAIVSRLTGYPSEMLNLDMDIESDLGIDSIKRVEILSALEEQMPDLPKVTPEMMGTLKTLGQICDYLTAGTATPSAAAIAPTAVDGMASASIPNAPISNLLIDIVSRLTGYPSEMLNLDMDIESDLGIDSIKRVEILSALEEQMPDLPKVTPEMMGTLKTLGQICEYLRTGSGSEQRPAPSAARETHTSKAALRFTVRIEPAPVSSGRPLKLPENHYIGVVSGQPDFSTALVDGLQQRSIAAKSLNHPHEVTQHHLGGLILIAPLQPQQAFEWARAAAPLLNAAVAKGDACFATVSFLDGAFGFKEAPLDDPLQGALAGLAKTAALEWPKVHCRAIDLDPRWRDRPAQIAALSEEIITIAENKAPEIGLAADRRVTLVLEATPARESETIRLGSEDVVVVTGGARGVTSSACKALARATGCRLALIGRSPAPDAEPSWLEGLSDENAMKKALLEHQFRAKASPRELEAAFAAVMANREIIRTMYELERGGIRALYFSADVCDPEALPVIFDQIRTQLGPIRGLIHGAGVLHDRLIAEKLPEQFARVFDTKVQGLSNLLRACREDDLRYVLLFSSVSARLGNSGQADYAMANEVLNKMARNLAAQRPGCKVAALNWGPWDGGMVTPSLRQHFRQQGVALIPLEQGAEALLAEMKEDPSGPVEIVIGGTLPGHTRQNPASSTREAAPEVAPLAQTVRREIDVERYPVLKSHCLDGRPVVPLALITEWLAHGALHANPGLSLHGIDNLRLLKGIILEEDRKTIRLMAGKPMRKGGLFEVAVEIRDGVKDGREVIHSQARAILADRLPPAPHFVENGHFKGSRPKHSMKEIYERMLFHGHHLRGIRDILVISENGMTAQVEAAPAPESWMVEPLRSRWIADPLILDCAFQMAIIWCHEQRGMPSLPSYAATYRQYRDRFPAQGVTCVLEVEKATERKMTGNYYFLDENRQVVAELKGYEAVMDPALAKAFRG